MSKSKPKAHPVLTDEEIAEISKTIPLTLGQKLDACIDQARRDQQKITDLTAALADAVDAVRWMFKACDEWAAEFMQHKRAMDWGVLNEAYLKGQAVLGSHARPPKEGQ